MKKLEKITKKDGSSYLKRGIPFKNGAPQVIFRKRNGNTFTKTYRSLKASKNSISAWRSNGGKVVKKATFKRKRK
jgi:hypothetical protein